MDGIGSIAVAMIWENYKYSEIPQLSEIMLTETMFYLIMSAAKISLSTIRN